MAPHTMRLTVPLHNRRLHSRARPVLPLDASQTRRGGLEAVVQWPSSDLSHIPSDAHIPYSTHRMTLTQLPFYHQPHAPPCTRRLCPPNPWRTSISTSTVTLTHLPHGPHAAPCTRSWWPPAPWSPPRTCRHRPSRRTWRRRWRRARCVVQAVQAHGAKQQYQEPGWSVEHAVAGQHVGGQGVWAAGRWRVSVVGPCGW